MEYSANPRSSKSIFCANPHSNIFISYSNPRKTSKTCSYDLTSPNFAQTEDMLNKAFGRFDDLSNLIFHSDQGWQYQMFQYHKALKERGITQSMSRKGNCLDNSPIENFFGKMKNEMFYGHEYEFKTLEQLQDAMEKYIEYYNNERIQVKLKGLTPCQARNQSVYSF